MIVINRHIGTASDLATLATEPEGPTLDYKGKVNIGEWWELAKDIAAFANHVGGVLVVGAFENKSTGLPSLQGLDPKEILAISTAYENTARDYCRPSPLVTCVVIPWNNGLEMLAVNVQAYPTGLVGARFYAPDKNGVNKPANAWQFVQRVGKNNSELPLETAIMHMSTHVRRTAILLAGISTPGPISLAMRKPSEPGDGILAADVVTFRGVDIERNTALVSFPAGGLITNLEQAVPLDDVEAVWRREDGTWCVRVGGYFLDWITLEREKRTEYISCSKT